MLLLLLACAHKDDLDDTASGDDTATTDDTAPVADPAVVYTPGDCLVEHRGATCGTVVLPEVRGSGTGRTVTVPVMVLPGGDGAEGAPPLVLFNGGPGSPAADLAGLFDRGGVMEPLGASRDVVLIGERGTWGATPELDCPELAEVDTIFTAPADERSAARLGAWQACHDRLVADGVDLSAYTNDARAADTPDVLRALGYSAWHLWGVSGGAVQVQRILRDHPDGVVTAHADSGGFPTAHMGDIPLDLLANVGDRYQRLFDACAADSACAAGSPELEADLWAVVAALEADPVPRTIVHPVTGVEGEVLLDGDTFLQVLTNSFAYVAYFPRVIAAARAGDYTLLDSVLPAAFVADTGTSFADGMYASVLCTDVGAATLGDVDTDGVPPEIVAALGPSVEELFATCAIWGVPAVPAAGAVESDVPTLFMEGLYDANRRPEDGRVAAEGYTHATVAEFPDRGHVVLDACAVELMGQLVADPAATVDLSCIPVGVEWIAVDG